MIKKLIENTRFALTGNTDGASTLVFEVDGQRFVGREALDAYQSQRQSQKEEDERRTRQRMGVRR